MFKQREVNLLGRHEQHPAAAWLLLAAGALTFGLAADRYATASDEGEQLTEKVGRLEERVTAAVDGNRRSGAKHKSEATANRSAAPFSWDIVLRELELAADNSVALITLETDAVAAQSRISGEARRIDDALALVDRLRSSPVTREAFLLSHEARKGTPVPVIAFAIQVDWRRD